MFFAASSADNAITSSTPLQCLTEKTKQLARKCTQHVRSASQHRQQQQQNSRRSSSAAVAMLSNKKAPSAIFYDDSVADVGHAHRHDDDTDDEVTDEMSLSSLSCFGLSQHRCIGGEATSTHATSVTTGLSYTTAQIPSSVKPPERTTKWYVKVIQIVERQRAS